MSTVFFYFRDLLGCIEKTICFVLIRNCLPELFYRKGALRYFATFPRKYLLQSLFRKLKAINQQLY